MKKKYIVLGMTLLVLAVAMPVLAADPFGLEDTANASGLSGYGNNIPVMIGNILGSVLGLVAVIFFALMLYGGMLWMTARGDDAQTKKATGTITAAIVGIMIILASYAITSFVFNSIGRPGSVTSGTLGGGVNTAVGNNQNFNSNTGTAMDLQKDCDIAEGSCKGSCDSGERIETGKLQCQGQVCCVPAGGTGPAACAGRCALASDKKAWEDEGSGDCEGNNKCLVVRGSCQKLTAVDDNCCPSGQDCCAPIMGVGFSCQNVTSKTCSSTGVGLCRQSGQGNNVKCAKDCVVTKP
jgi:hypothetical protein